MNVTQINIVCQLPLGHFYSRTLTRRRFIRVAVFVTLASQKSDFSLNLNHLPLETVKRNNCMQETAISEYIWENTM